MSGQFPAHHHSRHPPMGSPQSAQGHGIPSWSHPGAGQSQGQRPQYYGMGMHGGMGGPPQGPGYYPAPHPSMVGPGRGMQGPPQHAHMSSSGGSDRHSPHHSVVPGAWNNLGMPVTKAPGSHEGGRAPPASAHPQPSGSSSTSGNSGPGGPGNPLYSLQMLVNQDMNRNAAAAAAAASSSSSPSMPSSSYRAQTPTAAHQQETVDLSSASSEVYARMPQQSAPIPLTRAEKQPEHSSVRNGSIIASSTTVSSTNVTSPPTPLNGEVSSDSGIGSTIVAPSQSSPSENSVNNKDNNKTKGIVENKSPVSKEPVSVIAQTPPRDKPKSSPQIVTTVASSSSTSSLSPQSSETKAEKECHSLGSYDNHVDSSKASNLSDRDTLVQSRPQSADSQERTNPVIRSNAVEPSVTSVESTSNILIPANCTSTSKQSEDSLSIPSPQSSMKDNTSPVRSPKSGNLKRTKKVDSILENLVECGTKKLASNVTTTAPAVSSVTTTTVTTSEQPPQVPVSTVVVAPASVIVSPAVTNEDSSNGCNQEICVPSPGSCQVKSTTPQKSPPTAREDDVVSPTFSNSDDVENGKPRRKRKLDKPIRVSKSSDSEGTKNTSPDDAVVDETQKLGDSDVKEIKNELAPLPEPSVNSEGAEESVEAIAKDLHSDLNVKSEIGVRGESAEQLTLVLPATDEENVKKQETQDDTDALLSVLVSENDKIQDVKTETKNPFIEVENELEKMFAGIVETSEPETQLKVAHSSPAPTEESPGVKALESLSTLTSTSEVKRTLKRGRPKGSRNSSRRSSDSIFGTSSVDSTPKKKKKKQPKRPFEDGPSTSQAKKLKRSKMFLGENNRDSPLLKRKGAGLMKSELLSGTSVHASALYDSGSNTSSSRSRGPVVHVEGPRESPYSVTIINAPSRGEDEDGNDKGSNKKQANSNTRRKNTVYHNDLEYRGKVSRAGGSGVGLFSSTLSARYDSVTTDPTWICVFCKQGPHTKTDRGTIGNGDLFGPYLVGKEKCDEGGAGNPFSGCEPSADERDITEAQKKGNKNKKSLRGAEMIEQFHQKMSKKIKRSQSTDLPMRGMIPIAPSAGGKEEGCFEVWVHEACAVWAAGVYLVGSHIVGLQEAVWSSVRTMCSKCGEGGANVGCVRRACDLRVHYGCALDQGWDLNEESYIARCQKHKNGAYTSETILPT
ncbi:hypothetical protein R5R35_013302 [Gryllus longicercus]|uniref:PHD-type domain-containing protein n=1 Tax=Gryllus longicercus TaxID=2509291 RepID=A0AAN9V643_9ORTH